MKIVAFKENIEEIKEEMLCRFDFGYPPALISYLLNEYNHKDYWIGKDISEFENELKEDKDIAALKQAVSYAEEIGAYAPTPEKEHILPHVVLWNRTDGTIRSLDEAYSGFIDDINGFFRFLASREDIMKQLTVDDKENRIFTSALSKLPDESTDYVDSVRNRGFEIAKDFNIEIYTMGRAMDKALEKAKTIEKQYPENPVFIACSCLAKAIREVVIKAIHDRGEKGTFFAGFTFVDGLTTAYWRIQK